MIFWIRDAKDEKSLSFVQFFQIFFWFFVFVFSNLAEKLNMERDAAERWIVNLIRNARLDAKIDSQKVFIYFCFWSFTNIRKTIFFFLQGHVIMGTKGLSVYEQVMESTKQLSFRAQAIAFQLEKSVTEKHQQVTKLSVT